MNTQEPEEQITLSSAAFDQFKDDFKPTTVTKELSQAVQIKEQLKLFRIFDKKYINVNEKSASRIVSFYFRLAMLDPVPIRKRKIKMIPLLIGMAMLGFAWMTYTLQQAGHPLFSSIYIYTVIVAFMAIGLIFLVYVVKEFRNVLIFFSQHGRLPIIELLYRVPDKKNFHQFVSELIDNIQSAKSNSTYSSTQLLAAELTEHRKLRDEGAITAAMYEIAKNNIMKQH